MRVEMSQAAAGQALSQTATQESQQARTCGGGGALDGRCLTRVINQKLEFHDATRRLTARSFQRSCSQRRRPCGRGGCCCRQRLMSAGGRGVRSGHMSQVTCHRSHMSHPLCFVVWWCVVVVVGCGGVLVGVCVCVCCHHFPPFLSSKKMNPR